MITKEQECYVVIAPDKQVYELRDWECDIIDNIAKQYDEFTIISLRSNTVKFMKAEDNYGVISARTVKEVGFARPFYKLT